MILNLINNAFYAVNEKQKQNLNGYDQTVTITTAKVMGQVEIKVKDNGNGIPQKITGSNLSTLLYHKASWTRKKHWV